MDITMRELMNLMESRMDYQPSPKLAALGNKLQALQETASNEGTREVTALLKQMKRLYPDTRFEWETGMGQCSISFNPPIQVDDGYGDTMEIDVLINEVNHNDWRIAARDERLQGLFTLCEHVFQIRDHVYDGFHIDLDSVNV